MPLKVPSYRRACLRNLFQFISRLAPEYFARKSRNTCFLIGCGRSGTSLIDHVLGLHRDVASCPSEANDLWHPAAFPWWRLCLAATVPPIWFDSGKFTRHSLALRPASQGRRLRAAFGTCQSVCGKEQFIQKSAMTAFVIPYMLAEFPAARFVHIVRDGGAVAFSWAQRQFRAIQVHPDGFQQRGWNLPFREALLHCARSWRDHITEVHWQKDALELDQTGRFLEVRYEDFWRLPKSELDRIPGFLRIDRTGFNAASYSDVRDMDFKYRDTLSPDELAEVTEITRPGLEAKGYLN